MIIDLKFRNLTNIEYTDFTYLLKKYQYSLNLGDIVAGLIFSKESNGCLVEIGDKNAAFLPKEEALTLNYDQSWLYTVQEFFILSYNPDLSQLILSTKRLHYLRTWKRIKQLYSEDAIIYAMVISQNSGGLVINFDGIDGFLPNSHITNMNFKKFLIGIKLPLKFLIINEQINQIVFSHKRAILSFSNFTIGKLINTQAIRIEKYGIFVVAQNLQALLHISEIPKIILKEVKNIFKQNRFLRVMIIHIDEKQGRISVSVKNFHNY